MRIVLHITKHNSLLHNPNNSNALEPPTRCTLVVALGDLALRWPNLINPWSRSVFAPLRDADTAVRSTAMLVLTHLVLNDMFKVKGHMASLAVCLEDPDTSVARMAARFFSELTRRGVKGANPVYTHLPDVLSNLCGDAALPDAAFQRIMQRLLQHVSKERHVDGLVEKLCMRFQGSAGLERDASLIPQQSVSEAIDGAVDGAVAESAVGDDLMEVSKDDTAAQEDNNSQDNSQATTCVDAPRSTQQEQSSAVPSDTLLWRRLAFCLSQLTPTDKGLRCLLDNRRLYQEALWDPVVASCFDDLVNKALAAVRARARKGPQEGGPLLGQLATELQAALRVDKHEQAGEGDTGETTSEVSAVAALGATLQQVHLSASTAPAAHRLADAEDSTDEGPAPEGRRRRSVVGGEDEGGTRVKRRLVKKEGKEAESLRRRRSARTRKVAVWDSDEDGENQDSNSGFLVPAGRL